VDKSGDEQVFKFEKTFLAGCGFLNSCFGICPKLLINPIVAFFFKGSSIE